MSAQQTVFAVRSNDPENRRYFTRDFGWDHTPAYTVLTKARRNLAATQNPALARIEKVNVPLPPRGLPRFAFKRASDGLVLGVNGDEWVVPDWTWDGHDPDYEPKVMRMPYEIALGLKRGMEPAPLTYFITRVKDGVGSDPGFASLLPPGDPNYTHELAIQEIAVENGVSEAQYLYGLYSALHGWHLGAGDWIYALVSQAQRCMTRREMKPPTLDDQYHNFIHDVSHYRTENHKALRALTK